MSDNTKTTQKTIYENLKDKVTDDLISKKGNGKNTYNYLSWSCAFKIANSQCDNVEYKIHRDEDNVPIFGDEDIGYSVWTEITIDGITKEMWLPVTDYSNNAMKRKSYFIKKPKIEKEKKKGRYGEYFTKKLDNNGDEIFVRDAQGNIEYQEIFVQALSMSDISNTVMRCLVKNFAMFGLGLDLFIKADLLHNVDDIDNITGEKKPEQPPRPTQTTSQHAQQNNNTELKINQASIDRLNRGIEQKHINKAGMLQHYKVSSVKELTQKQYDHIIDKKKAEGVEWS